MMPRRLSGARVTLLRVCLRRVGRAASRWRARFALCAAPLGLSTASDGTVTTTVGVCEVAGVSVETIEGSRLLQADRERLKLMRGRTLGCQHPRARHVQAAVAGALAAWPLDVHDRPGFRRRLPVPMRVHVNPRLPARQAPLAGIEVHVTTREVLVSSSALDALDAEVWRHELLHVLAARPPEASPIGRRLWLTLEEGVVEYLMGETRGRRPAATHVAPPVLPALEWLASPAYDPHPLAEALAGELGRVEPHPVLDRWLSCLAAVSSMPGNGLDADWLNEDGDARGRAPRPPGAFASIFGAFTSRCSPDAASHLSAAIGRWWGMPQREPPRRGAPQDLFTQGLRLSEPR